MLMYCKYNYVWPCDERNRDVYSTVYCCELFVIIAPYGNIKFLMYLYLPYSADRNGMEKEKKFFKLEKKLFFSVKGATPRDVL